MRSIEVPEAVAKMMPIGICERSQRASESPSSPGMAMSRMARWNVFVLGKRAHCGGIADGCHVEAVRDEILGDGVPQIGLVLDNDNPRAQCGLASAVSGK